MKTFVSRLPGGSGLRDAANLARWIVTIDVCLFCSALAASAWLAPTRGVFLYLFAPYICVYFMLNRTYLRVFGGAGAGFLAPPLRWLRIGPGGVALLTTGVWSYQSLGVRRIPDPAIWTFVFANASVLPYLLWTNSAIWCAAEGRCRSAFSGHYFALPFVHFAKVSSQAMTARWVLTCSA